MAKEVEWKRLGLSMYIRMFPGTFCVLGEVEPLCNLWSIQKCDPSVSQSVDSAVLKHF